MNYYISIFLLLLVIIISQSLHPANLVKEGYTPWYAMRATNWSLITRDRNILRQIDSINTIQQAAVQNDNDIIAFMHNVLNPYLNNSSLYNVTKLYFLATIVPMAFAPFFAYQANGVSSQYNTLHRKFPRSFSNSMDYTLIQSIVILCQAASDVSTTQMDVTGGYYIPISNTIIGEVNSLLFAYNSTHPSY